MFLWERVYPRFPAPNFAAERRSTGAMVMFLWERVYPRFPATSSRLKPLPQGERFFMGGLSPSQPNASQWGIAERS